MRPYRTFTATAVRMLIVCACCMLLPVVMHAQKKPAAPGKPDEKLTIYVLHNDNMVHEDDDSGGVNKFVGNVIFSQEHDTLYCDSMYMRQTNNIEAFGNVRIVQEGGTEGQSDYLRYTGNTKMAYMLGNVKLTDGKNTLWTTELNYDVGKKYGVYTQGGTLQADSTTVSSELGNYNAKTKYARFMRDVFITDPQYNVRSNDLGYYTESKIVDFYDTSVVTSDQSVLRTTRGTYDTKQEIAHFVTRSSIFHEDHYIEADSLDYNKFTGHGKAVGSVIAWDTTNKATLYCGVAIYKQKLKWMKAMIKPVLKKVTDKDSLYIRADTMLAFPVPKPEDSVKNTHTVIKKKGKKEIKVEVADSSSALERDSTRKQIFIAYHHVLIFSDSLQGKCDSLSYSQVDSVIRMMYDPIAWSRKSQITGDTILLYTDSTNLNKIYVPDKAFVVSQSGPTKAQMFDQVQGKTLTGYFVNNAIDNMVVTPDAECIYYSKDDDGAYLGVSQATSERMRIFFKDEEVNKIKLEEKPHQTMTPLEKADIPKLRLGRFKWLIKQRPKNKEELFK